jgi:hypothetical protein
MLKFSLEALKKENYDLLNALVSIDLRRPGLLEVYSLLSPINCQLWKTKS